MPHHDKIVYPVELIRLWISNGETQQQIADRLRAELDSRVTPKLIYKVCKKHGIECQRTGPREGAGHPEWKGGKVNAKLGYVKIYAPEHPSCVAVNQRRAAQANGGYYRKQKYVWEHRLVMEKHLGRFLEPQEVVHHKNGDPSDNRTENLIVFRSNAEHLAVDLKGRCPKWTEDGKARLRSAAERRSAIAHQRKELDAQAQLQTSLPLKASPESSAPVLSETVLTP